MTADLLWVYRPHKWYDIGKYLFITLLEANKLAAFSVSISSFYANMSIMPNSSTSLCVDLTGLFIIFATSASAQYIIECRSAVFSFP